VNFIAYLSTQNISQANLISSILFGDGAAAALVTGRQVPGPKIMVSETYTFPIRWERWVSIFAIPAFTSCSKMFPK